MEWKRRAGPVWLVVLGLSSSCATTLYEGRELTPAEGAVVGSRESVIDDVDGKDVRGIRGGNSQYILPPGPHVIGFSVKRITPGLFSSTVTTSNNIHVCLNAAAGHQYITEPSFFGARWQPTVVDWVDPAVDASRPVPIACDRDGMAAADDIRKQWAGQTIRLAHTRPVLDFTVGSALSFGGDNVLTAQLSNGDTRTLSAGSGVTVGVGTMITPFWFADRIGLGVGAEIGIKFQEITASNASVTFTRYPAIGTLNMFVRTGQKWFLLASGGIDKDLGISLTGDGDASAINGTASSHVGGLGRLGMYFRASDGLALTLGIGYTKLTYYGPGGTSDASSFNFLTNIHWSVL